ncbi:hypothetical protein [Actinoplanes couchii]|uniref:Calcium-binding protein n=1 Tax=Actinoplanes couchii TaxID=403638 RepID=A0ABQ3XJH9_9ACTN|nr:hypothetical protein [Actinoplanes couchii]MDR6324352.1 hypothetical protein [Actinoplanes couchii]GID58648.1 hypothetical protein Aco03nite_070520 [Actinoplanes couchii]
MTSVRNRVFAALLALTPAAGLFAASPAQAAPLKITVKSVAVSKSTFVLGSKAGSGDIVKGKKFTQVGTTSTYKGSLNLCGKDTAGRWTADVYGVVVKTGSTEFDSTNTVTKSIYLKRPSSLTLNAAPEPVVKGKKLTTKGVLKVNGKVLAGTTVKIYFQATGASTYTYKGAAKTNAKGVYTKAFTATKSGVWKAVYAGGSARNAASAVDAVKVK